MSLLEYSIFLSLSLAFPPPTPSPSRSLSDVIVSCPVDADAQLKAVCTDPKRNVYCSAGFELREYADVNKSDVGSI